MNFFAIELNKSICFIFGSITKLKSISSPSPNKTELPIAAGGYYKVDAGATGTCVDVPKLNVQPENSVCVFPLNPAVIVPEV